VQKGDRHLLGRGETEQREAENAQHQRSWLVVASISSAVFTTRLFIS
jgi:hypothetical protein